MNLFDLILFRWFNSFAGISTPTDFLVIFCAHYLPWIVGFWAMWLLLFSGRRPLQSFFSVFGGVGAAMLATLAIHALYGRLRPFVALPGVSQLVIQSSRASFPSAHATFFFALATGIYMWERRTGKWFFVLAITISVARVIAGIHWPTDIIAGAALGVLVVFCIAKLVFVRHS